MIPLTGLFGLLAPLAPVPFSHMRFQPRRMRSGWTDRTHTPLSAATSEHPSPGAVEPPSGATEVTAR